MANESIPRVKRVAREIKNILGNYVVKNFSTSDFGLLSVSAVALSKDFKLAKVYISCFQSPLDDVEILEALNQYRKDMQNTLSRELKIKFIPKLSFFIDDCFSENFELMGKLKSLGFSTSTGDFVE